MSRVSKKSSAALHGVLPVLQMAYYEDETIDFETLCREIDWLYERGADGVVLRWSANGFDSTTKNVGKSASMSSS